MPVARAAIIGVVLGLVTSGSVHAAQQAPPPAPSPAVQAPAPQPPAPSQPGVPAVAAQPRTFSAPAGLLFNTVRPDRVEDFEKAMGYLQAALAKSTNERVQAQAKGWRVFKAAEPGPSSTVLYVFVLDPTVPGADYGLSRILADAFDQTQLQEIWKLYTGSVTGGSLLNLTPVQAVEPTPKPPAP